MKPILRLTYLLAFLALFSCLGIGNQAKASHAMGYDLWYECLGGNQYTLTLRLYRDCKGVSAPTSVSISFAAQSGGCGNFNVTLPKDNFKEVSPLCAAQISNSACNGGTTFPGVQEHTYIATTTLTAAQAACTWLLTYTLCCRNAAIDNLAGPGGQSMYVETTMDPTAASNLCNNSPQFNSLPTPFICAGQTYCYNHGATDKDGDSLVYSLISAQTGGGTNITYASSFSPTCPFWVDTAANYPAGAPSCPAGASPFSPTSGPYFFFDTQTGSMCVTPTVAQDVVVAVKVDEYRNGVQIGHSTRDLQIVVMTGALCGNAQPTLTPPGFTNFSGPASDSIDSNSVQICIGDTVSFEITATDGNASDTIAMTTNLAAALPGATFTTVVTNNVTVGTFTWVPSVTDTGYNAFAVTIQDNGCPILMAQTFGYDVWVFKEINAGPDKGACPANQPLTLNAGGGSNVSWMDIGGGPPVGFVNPADSTSISAQVNPACCSTYTYVVKHNPPLAACKSRDTINVTSSPNFALNAGVDDTICQNQQVFLNGTTNAPGPATISWFPSGSLNNTSILAPIASPQQSTDYTITVTDSGGCVISDTVSVVVSGTGPILQAEPVPDSICGQAAVNDSTQLTLCFTFNCGADTAAFCTSPAFDLDIDQVGDAGGGDTLSPIWFNQSGGFGQGPYGNYRSYKIFSTELDAAGAPVCGGLISGVGFDFKTIGTTIPNLEVYIWCQTGGGYSGPNPNLQSLAVNLQRVRASAPYVPPGTGYQVIPFDTNYAWDGVQNLELIFCVTDTNLGGTISEVVTHSTLPDTMTQYSPYAGMPAFFQSTCGTNFMGMYDDRRPNIRVEMCPAAPGGMTFAWAPGGSLDDATITSPMAFPNTTTTYVITANDTTTGCAGSATATVVTNVGCPLPAENIVLNGSRAVNGTFLRWDVEEEKDIAMYVVERQTYHNGFQKIGEKEASAVAGKFKSYSFIDAVPNPGSNVYRVKAIGNNGNVQFSNIVEVVYDLGPGVVGIFPNPTSSHLGFNVEYFAVEDGDLEITIIDVHGRMLDKNSVGIGSGMNVVKYDTNKLRAGVYFVRTQHGSQTDVVKLVVE